jgi:hypothetical protein
MIAHIKDNAIRVTNEQFPEIDKRAFEASRKLGLTGAPAAYVMQAGGVMDATLQIIYAAAGKHKVQAGTWPCSAEEPEVKAYAAMKQCRSG